MYSFSEREIFEEFKNATKVTNGIFFTIASLQYAQIKVGIKKLTITYKSCMVNSMRLDKTESHRLDHFFCCSK